MAFGSAYLIRPPQVYRWIYSEAIFRKRTDQKKVYLTFDDGPHPEATPAALRVLESHGVKATFFVLGNNAKQHPELMAELRRGGHQIGNHGMNHLNGWQTSTEAYVKDLNEGKVETKSDLFRPAYGKLTLGQYNQIKKTNEIILWDVISGDFDQSINAAKVIENVLDNVRDGSVIVMHDSKKAYKNMIGSLDKIIEKLNKEGFEFDLL